MKSSPMRRRVASLLVLLAGTLAGLAQAHPATAARPVITVFAAASLTESLGESARGYEAAQGVTVKLSVAASSVLARQIESGAAADLFISADSAWMDYLEERGLVQATSRRDLLGNRLVLVAPAGSRVVVDLRPGVDLAAALGSDGRLAIAEPEGVPAGRYAVAALQALGAWQAVENRTVPAENVRAALAFVARGEAPLGVVYATDAAVEPRVRVVATFPPESHAPIVYPAALIRGASPAAAAFLAWLAGPEAGIIFTTAGFTVLKQGR